ncbi:MAG: DUF1836 domain-containing protein [Eubacteriales bacterium]|nr:DUF1836 domain-containing protein [Eubacteriales bacterium]
MDITINRLLRESMDRGALDPDQIPDLDLYIDQIIMLIENFVGTQPDGQPPLTRTMIHNYSKAGLISPVKGKKYSKEHIMEMFAVYSLKNTLSIEQIKRVLCALDNGQSDLLNEKYQEYLQGNQQLREDACQAIEQLMEGVASDDYAGLYTRLLLLADMAQMLTDFARRIAEQCYPDPPMKGKKK